MCVCPARDCEARGLLAMADWLAAGNVAAACSLLRYLVYYSIYR